MATMTLPMAEYIDDGKRSKNRSLLGLVIGLVLGVVLYFTINPSHKVVIENAITGAVQQPATYAVNPVPKMQDKIVSYIFTVNPKLDEGVAYRLADGIIEQHEKHKLPIDLQMGLIKVESHYQQYALSPTGAVGFYQILPRWHIDKINRLFKDGVVESKNLYTAKMQSELGGAILSDCLKKHRHNTKKALLCYNGSQHDETAEYARRVMEAKQEAAGFI